MTSVVLERCLEFHAALTAEAARLAKLRETANGGPLSPIQLLDCMYQDIANGVIVPGQVLPRVLDGKYAGCWIYLPGLRLPSETVVPY